MSGKDLLAGLNPGQRATALSRGHTLAIACPGSGKTKTLAAKAAFFLREGAKVAAATFTRDAAMELRERIVKEAGPGSQSRLLVGTFHSLDLLMAFPHRRKSDFGASILKDMRSPFTKPWKIVNEGDRRSFIIRAINEAKVMSLSWDEASRIIDVVKATKITEGLEPQQIEMVRVYRDLLARTGQIDLQDIIIQVNDALSDGTMSPLPVDYLMIDEFQDTDDLGFNWASTHGKAGISVTVVGDDDQSIYSFRNALGFDGLKKFEKMFSAQRILLDTNYRCHAEILGSAETLITRNTERIEKRLFAAKGPGGKVFWRIYESALEEAEGVAEEAKNAIPDNASFAVIARTNRQLDEVQSALIQADIPYRRPEGSSIFSLPEVQVYGAALRTIIKPTANDVDKVLAWAGINEQDLEAIHRKVGESIYVGAPADFANTNVSPGGLEIWRSFAKEHGKWLHLNRIECFPMLNLSVRQWLEKFLQKPYTPKNLLKAWKLYSTPKGKTLEEWLKVIAAAERNGKSKKKEEAEEGKEETANIIPVDLITAHGSKGLEYDRVCIIGLEEGVFPGKDSPLEEERRLMFVAMTRARQKLWLSASESSKPSIFVEESGILRKSAAPSVATLFS